MHSIVEASTHQGRRQQRRTEARSHARAVAGHRWHPHPAHTDRCSHKGALALLRRRPALQLLPQPLPNNQRAQAPSRTARHSTKENALIILYYARL